MILAGELAPLRKVTRFGQSDVARRVTSAESRHLSHRTAPHRNVTRDT